MLVANKVDLVEEDDKAKAQAIKEMQKEYDIKSLKEQIGPPFTLFATRLANQWKKKFHGIFQGIIRETGFDDSLRRLSYSAIFLHEDKNHQISSLHDAAHNVLRAFLHLHDTALHTIIRAYLQLFYDMISEVDAYIALFQAILLEITEESTCSEYWDLMILKDLITDSGPDVEI